MNLKNSKNIKKRKKRNEKIQCIKDNSKILKEINRLNYKYYQYFNVSFLSKEVYYCKNHKQVENFDFEKAIGEYYLQNKEIIKENEKQCSMSIKLKKAYIKEFEEIIQNNYSFSNEDDDIEIEENLIYEKDYSNLFSNDCNIYLYAKYSSPAGRNHYTNERCFYPSDAEKFGNIILDNNKKSKISAATIERRKMSPGLRYDVLKRDGFKCVLCGRTAEQGCKLHVDHIIPVSKGGKTEVNNLRTLCEDCNLGKSDKFDWFGDN